MTTAKPKRSPAERAAAIASNARGYADKGEAKPAPALPTEPAAGQPGPQRELTHWHVYKPGIRDPFEVTVYPPQTQREMTTIVYPGCGCIPREP